MNYLNNYFLRLLTAPYGTDPIWIITYSVTLTYPTIEYNAVSKRFFQKHSIKHIMLSSIAAHRYICSVNAITCSPSNQAFWWMSRIRRTCLKCELLKPRNTSWSTLGERDERSIVYPPFFFFFRVSRDSCTQMCVKCVGLRAWTALNDCIYSSLNREPVVYVRARIGLDQRGRDGRQLEHRPAFATLPRWLKSTDEGNIR